MQRLRRTMMFVPGNNPGMMADAHIYGPDSIMLDLEDSVSMAEKDAARLLVHNALKTIDYGTLKVGDVRTVEMVYTNIGKKPLLLENVTTNCDCTEVEWSRKPLMPGKSDVIRVTYTAKNPGLISKWVTVMSNAETDRVILKTTGKVEEK